MKIGIGIDTGGTYTDAVVYDFDGGQVLARGKTPTDRGDLAGCIGRALDALPAEWVRQADFAALSTTLATNACVENKGGRSGLVLMGTTPDVLEWIGAEQLYGLKPDSVLCVDTHSSFDGKVIDEPDWDALTAAHADWFSAFTALSVVEINAVRNGGVCEKHARDYLQKKYGVPVIMGCELADGLNMMERGATALLNARLLPVMREFTAAVDTALAVRSLHPLTATVRSDGTLMNGEQAAAHPVQTILSGPAASISGGRGLADCTDGLIIDMGGTTTDISVVRDGLPLTTETVRIGNWQTQVHGVYIDTFGLGGDSELRVENGQPALQSRRVLPVCAAASRWPSIRPQLAALHAQKRGGSEPLHEFLYLVHSPDPAACTQRERELAELLRDGPALIGGGKIDAYDPGSERLEAEGAVMRIGFTPTDAMHILGDFDEFDREASVECARYLLDCCLIGRQTDDAAVIDFAKEIYELAERKLYQNIARVLLIQRYPALQKDGLGPQLEALVSESWQRRGQADRDPLFELRFETAATLIGIGAPTHLFLPPVAEALGARCVIPEHAGVANAVGAVLAEVSATETVEVAPVYSTGGVTGYTVHTDAGSEEFEKPEPAAKAAERAARRQAEAEARRRGAAGKLTVTSRVQTGTAFSKNGSEIELGARAVATARGRLG